jgi:formate dehydrogenase major subunit
MGSFPHELAGYRHVSDAATRALFDAEWGVQLEAEPGLTEPREPSRCHQPDSRIVL